MNYATWNLEFIDENYLDGPESTIVARGGKAISIWSNGSAEKGATILGKVEGDISNLSRWNFTVISRIEAEQFIADNFTPSVDENGFGRSLEQALTVLD